jgi:hypothetical protein
MQRHRISSSDAACEARPENLSGAVRKMRRQGAHRSRLRSMHRAAWSRAFDELDFTVMNVFKDLF